MWPPRPNIVQLCPFSGFNQWAPAGHPSVLASTTVCNTEDQSIVCFAYTSLLSVPQVYQPLCTRTGVDNVCKALFPWILMVGSSWWFIFWPKYQPQKGLPPPIPSKLPSVSYLKIFFMFIFERERDRAWAWAGKGQRERETQNVKQVQALSCQNRSWRRTQTHEP